MISLQQLESFLWQTADILRGNMDDSEYKDYIFAMLFMKCLPKNNVLLRSVVMLFNTTLLPKYVLRNYIVKS